MRFGQERKGFSLIEIGIVMVVIGLILAAVMKGKDVIKGAEVKEVSQNFMGKWVNVLDNYYDKTGFNLLGDKTDPTINSSAGQAVCDSTDGTNGTWLLALNNAGIDVQKIIRTNTDNFCKARPEGQFTTTVNDVSAEIYNQSVTSDAVVSVANTLEFKLVPTDVARAFDTLIDGAVDGSTGRVINDAGALTGAVTEGWPDATAGSTATVTVILEH